MYHVLMHEVPLENCIEPTDVRNLFVAPASLDLAGAEIELVPAFSRETRLRKAIDGVIDDYDYVLIDCPPTLGLLTVNGLAAAREVLVPIQIRVLRARGPRPTVAQRRPRTTQPESRTRGDDDRVRDVRRPHEVVRPGRSGSEGPLRRQGRTAIVPRSVRLSEAPSFGQPIITFDPRSRGAVAYRDVAKEVHYGSA